MSFCFAMKNKRDAKNDEQSGKETQAGALEGCASRRRASAVGMYPDMGILREVVTQKAPRRAEGTLRGSGALAPTQPIVQRTSRDSPRL